MNYSKKTKAQLIDQIEKLQEELLHLRNSSNADTGSILSTDNNAEARLSNSERKNLALLDNSPVCTKVVDLDFNLQFMSNAGVEALKLDDITEFYGKPYPLSFYPDSFKIPMNENLRKAKETGETITQEAPILDVEGNEIWFHSTIIPVNDNQGNLEYIMVLSIESTERRRTEEALKESEKKYRILFEKSADAVLIIEGDRFVDCNSATVKMLGYKNKQELLDTHPSELSPEFQPDGRSSFEKANEIISIAFSKGSHRFEWEHVRHNGEIFPVEVLLTAIPSGDKKRLHVVWRDITDRKRLEELESRAARLETAGTIAGQVSHDFNNLLAPLVGYPEFIREELPENCKSHKFLDQMEAAANRIASINQDLLTMGRRGHYNQEVLNLNVIVENALQELEPFSETLECQIDLDKDLMKIYAGGAQLHRMLSNLLHNAIDAMQNVGKLSIKTENFYVDDVSLMYGRVPKGEYVKLTIKDSGCGIPDNIVQKIFDPFFTTKEADKKRGSGLGMSVVDAVVKDHNGFLDLSTKVGEGTSFFIYFPITRKLANVQESSKVCGGSETILVVDDDNIQRDVTSKLLTKLGYQVSTVESGEKAVEFIRENPQDLVSLDMIMPGGIDGTECYRQILEICPDQKAIIISGYSESDRVAEAKSLGVGCFVKKPISLQVVASAVRTELDRKATTPKRTPASAVS